MLQPLVDALDGPRFDYMFDPYLFVIDEPNTAIVSRNLF